MSILLISWPSDYVMVRFHHAVLTSAVQNASNSYCTVPAAKCSRTTVMLRSFGWMKYNIYNTKFRLYCKNSQINVTHYIISILLLQWFWSWLCQNRYEMVWWQQWRSLIIMQKKITGNWIRHVLYAIRRLGSNWVAHRLEIFSAYE